MSRSRRWIRVQANHGFNSVVNTQRLDGFMDAVAAAPNLKVVASQQADWTRATGVPHN